MYFFRIFIIFAQRLAQHAFYNVLNTKLYTKNEKIHRPEMRLRIQVLHARRGHHEIMIHKFFLSLPHFQFDESEINTKNIWMEMFKNLGNMDRISPSVYERADEGLLKLLKKAESSALSDEEIDLYEACMKKLEDEIDMKEYGFEIGMAKGREVGLAQGLEEGIAKGIVEGRAEGIVEGRAEAVRQTVQEMKKNGIPTDLIVKITGLTPTEIESI